MSNTLLPTRTTCKIQWIDKDGKPTPHDAPAIGQVYCEEYVSQVPGAVGGVIKHDRTENYPICADHLTQLSEPEMYHWHFMPLKGGQQ